jgi:hypothetical protein
MFNIVPDKFRGEVTWLRTDSVFSSYRLMKWLIKRGIEYFIEIPMQPRVQKEIKKAKFQPMKRDICLAEFDRIV